MPRNENTQDYNPVVARIMVADEDEHFTDPDQNDLFGDADTEPVLTLDEALHAVNTGEGMPPVADKPQTNLFGDAEPWDEIWGGMPEFLQEDLRPARTLYVHFRTDEDVNDFLELIGQKISPKTQYIWYPYMKLANFNHLHWVTNEEQQ